MDVTCTPIQLSPCKVIHAIRQGKLVLPVQETHTTDASEWYTQHLSLEVSITLTLAIKGLLLNSKLAMPALPGAWKNRHGCLSISVRCAYHAGWCIEMKMLYKGGNFQASVSALDDDLNSTCLYCKLLHVLQATTALRTHTMSGHRPRKLCAMVKDPTWRSCTSCTITACKKHWSRMGLLYHKASKPHKQEASYGLLVQVYGF